MFSFGDGSTYTRNFPDEESAPQIDATIIRGQNLTRTSPSPATGAAILLAGGLVAFGACARNTMIVDENVPRA
jgi:hypothetical protein